MASDSETSAVSAASRARLSDLSFATVDADFAENLDRWGAYHRMIVGGATMAISFTILPQPSWLLAVAALYALVAALMLHLLHLAATPERKRWVRTIVMVIDIATVTAFAYRWGARTSPAAFMYLPVVSGWTLVPQRHLGRLAAVAALTAYGLLLFGEQSGFLPTPPDLEIPLSQRPVSGVWLYFVTLTCSLAAVHGLVDLTVTRLREHHRIVTRLTVEKREREREAQLASQLEEAQRLEALGRLAGGVAHDINNLLTIIMGCAELADSVMDRDAAGARRALTDLQSAAERGGSLTAQLLDFASRRFTRPELLDLNEAVERALLLLERLLDENITLRMTRCERDCVVNIDPGGLERVLLNLAVNARDAMPDGGTLQITVARRGEDEVELSVSDTGFGIDSEALPRIFEPFFTTKPRGKGTGLGLASVYGIVKQSRGQIEVDSLRNQGTTFRIRFPRSRERPSTPAPKPVAAAAPSASILVVDDDANVREIVLAHLEDAGYAVLAASSGEEAWSLLEKQHGVRMLVSDVSMPGMSGVDLARKARAVRPDLPILLISGYSEELHGKLDGLARFLGKPFTKQSLLDEVSRGLLEKT